MGSDGLFDNVFDHEIVSTITKHQDVVEAGNYFLKILFITFSRISKLMLMEYIFGLNGSKSIGWSCLQAFSGLLLWIPVFTWSQNQSKFLTNLSSFFFSFLKKKKQRRKLYVFVDMQGFDVPWWKKLVGQKLTGMTNGILVISSSCI